MRPPAKALSKLSAPSGSETYRRERDLPRLLRLWPEEVRRLSAGDQAWLVERIAQMLRAERQRGLTRHWSYDLSRHAALLRAYRAERALLETAGSSRCLGPAIEPPPQSGRSIARQRLSLPAFGG